MGQTAFYNQDWLLATGIHPKVGMFVQIWRIPADNQEYPTVFMDDRGKVDYTTGYGIPPELDKMIVKITMGKLRIDAKLIIKLAEAVGIKNADEQIMEALQCQG
jgi:hypothetical protein